MATISINTGSPSGFLYNSGSGTARLCITAETQDFDTETLRLWQDEGFDVIYIPYEGGEKEYTARLRSVKEGLRVGENYAVIAFGDAASFCLEHFLKPMNVNRICALVAYYPTVIPDTQSRFPQSLRVLTHLAGHTVDMTSVPTALGLQGKKRRRTKQINPGIGTGERLKIGFPTYTYEYVLPGFAEHDLDEYDRLAAELAWTRSLHVLRRGFGNDLDLEGRWEEHQEGKFFSPNLSSTMDQYATHLTPTVTYTPTLTGGFGTHSLRRFYEQHFLRALPPTMRLRLISRTIGADRIVDELYTSFDHTQEIPWMLPGVPATNRKVEIILVSIVSCKAGKLCSEHVYWDQASVLVQVGLLDLKLMPGGVRGVDRLPVVGVEAARRILREDSEVEEYHNGLIQRAERKGKGREGSERFTETGKANVPAVHGKGKRKAVDQQSKSTVKQNAAENAKNA